MKMANTEKKEGFFARFRKNKTAESPGETPKASASKQSKSSASQLSPAKPTPPSVGASAQTRNDDRQPVDTAALVENLFKTMLSFSTMYLKIVDNTIKTISENLSKTAENLKEK